MLEGASPAPVLHLALAYRDAGRADAARGLLETLAAELPADSALAPEVARALGSLER